MVHLALVACLLTQASGPATPLAKVLKADRLTDDRYRLIMFQTDSGISSGFVLINRAIEHVTRDGSNVIRVQEESRAKDNTVSVYLDAHSLAPLAYESRLGDTLSIAATMVGDSLHLTETRRGVVTNSVSPVPAGVYWSNSFSELLQANDFAVHPSITFSTLTPGAPANTFTVERIGRREFERGLSVWVVQFTRTDAAGTSSPGGYRYLDTRTGQVLFFTTKLDSTTGFSYQVLPLR